MYESKVDSVAREYSHLITSQLESQRTFFEELRAKDALEHQRALQAVQKELTEHKEQACTASSR